MVGIAELAGYLVQTPALSESTEERWAVAYVTIREGFLEEEEDLGLGQLGWEFAFVDGPAWR